LLKEIYPPPICYVSKQCKILTLYRNTLAIRKAQVPAVVSCKKGKNAGLQNLTGGLLILICNKIKSIPKWYPASKATKN